jgi:hypothetical protein
VGDTRRVCVCVWEREREREREIQQHGLKSTRKQLGMSALSGRDKSQAVIRRLFTTKVLLWPTIHSCGLMCQQVSLGKVSFPEYLFSSVSYCSSHPFASSNQDQVSIAVAVFVVFLFKKITRRSGSSWTGCESVYWSFPVPVANCPK